MPICEKHGCELVIDENNYVGNFFKEMKKKFSTEPGSEQNESDVELFYTCPLCEKDSRERMEERERKIEADRLIQIEREEFNITHSGIPKIYHNAEIDQISDQKPIIDFIKTGTGFLFVYGGCGCGKTHSMCAVKKYYNTKRLQCSLFFAYEIFLDIRKSFNKKDEYCTEDEIIKRCCPTVKDQFNYRDHFAIFDDIGAQKISEYVIEIWYDIINQRYQNGYKTIFTSNLSLEEISKTMSDRIASRLASGIIYKMNGKDRRLDKR